MRIDGFGSLRAGTRAGYVVTPVFEWPGGELSVNIDPRFDDRAHPTYCQGEVVVEVLDAAGAPLPGFSRDDAIPCRQNTLNMPRAATACRWSAEAGRTPAQGLPVRLRFWLEQAHLYSFRIG